MGEAGTEQSHSGLPTGGGSGLAFPSQRSSGTLSSSVMLRVLLAENDHQEKSELSLRLRRHGHKVLGAESGEKALDVYEDADLILLDLELKDLDGLEVCRAIRAFSDIPIIVVTALASELDCVLALQAGADDYVIKPYGFRELMARMEAVMRRIKPKTRADHVIECGPLQIDTNSREVLLKKRRIPMSRKEFDLLCLLASQPDTVVSREKIMQQIWEGSWSRRTVDTHVSSIRNKLGDRSWIVTVRGVGFMFGRAA